VLECGAKGSYMHSLGACMDLWYHNVTLLLGALEIPLYTSSFLGKQR